MIRTVALAAVRVAVLFHQAAAMIERRLLRRVGMSPGQEGFPQR